MTGKDWQPYYPNDMQPVPMPSMPASGWGQGIGSLNEEELKTLLEQLEGLKKETPRKKDQFDIEDLSELEKKE